MFYCNPAATGDALRKTMDNRGYFRKSQSIILYNFVPVQIWTTIFCGYHQNCKTQWSLYEVTKFGEKLHCSLRGSADEPDNELFSMTIPIYFLFTIKEGKWKGLDEGSSSHGKKGSSIYAPKESVHFAQTKGVLRAHPDPPFIQRSTSPTRSDSDRLPS